MKNFRLLIPALHVFGQKMPIFFVIFVGGNFFLQNIYGSQSMLPFNSPYDLAVISKSGLVKIANFAWVTIFQMSAYFKSGQEQELIWVIFPRTGKMSKMCPNFFFEASLWFFKVFSTVLKRLCPLESKNTFVYPSKKFWSPVQHPCFCLIGRFLGKD